MKARLAPIEPLVEPLRVWPESPGDDGIDVRSRFGDKARLEIWCRDTTRHLRHRSFAYSRRRGWGHRAGLGKLWQSSARLLQLRHSRLNDV